jgi:hypothetical protein
MLCQILTDKTQDVGKQCGLLICYANHKLNPIKFLGGANMLKSRIIVENY